ncbi:4-hydroxybenzoate 3-monooxygenase [Flexivirga sp. ID2601S]|uniref:4-hydroxybenzoate 3-monooxygenase n=1 Tax=Flexivirga aerilata TaxID=1656889 RepID=A0A849AGD9_9MICO|nr:4-hydroxybenzoate 3-monooxygenase [Flexivirga aerilata]
MSAASRIDTEVGIIGAGPAGLLLSHLLDRASIDSVVVERRTRAEIEQTHRAGILEQGSVQLLVETGVSNRVLTDGREHHGIDLRFGGVSHRLDFGQLVDASSWLYPQTDVFRDLAAARDRDGGDVRYGVADAVVDDPTLDRPTIHTTTAEGEPQAIRCRTVVGADGAHSQTRQLIAGRAQYFRQYPFAWFGILCEAPPAAAELVYCRSDRGFALISQRTETLQRMYFQCDPAIDASTWSDDRIWSELQSRVAGEDDFRLPEGPIVQRTVLPFRSFVCEPMRHANLLLVGDAAHTVPPTGAKGLNLALADAALAADMLTRAHHGDRTALDGYSARAQDRVWRAQHFSYWMTTLLHDAPNEQEFDRRRQLAELRLLTRSAAGARLLAEGYTGWPHEPLTDGTPSGAAHARVRWPLSLSGR